MDNIDQTLAKLQQKVSCFVKNADSNSNQWTFPTAPQINMNSKSILYCSIPVIIFFTLLLWKPHFLTKEIRIEGSLPTYKINMLKLLISTSIITVLINISLFAFFVKINK